MRRWAQFVVLVVAAFALLATSQARWSVNHKQGGVLSLPAGQQSARFSLTADSSHALSLQLRLHPSFVRPGDSGATVRARVVARGLKFVPKEARMSDAVDAGTFEEGVVTFREVVITQPSHADFDVVVERVSGEQALSIAWDAEAETGERGDSTVPKSAFVRVVETPSP
ncbi:MAG: hypothetical protein IPM35_33845 [Myxococcales bacterium]|nr:hypothetical protein [Myxococcales bacterium]